MARARFYEEFIGQDAKENSHGNGRKHGGNRGHPQFVGAEENTIRRHHVKSGMGNVHDAGHPEYQ